MQGNNTKTSQAECMKWTMKDSLQDAIKNTSSIFSQKNAFEKGAHIADIESSLWYLIQPMKNQHKDNPFIKEMTLICSLLGPN
jgi:hypothetical protein